MPTYRRLKIGEIVQKDDDGLCYPYNYWSKASMNFPGAIGRKLSETMIPFRRKCNINKNMSKKMPVYDTDERWVEDYVKNHK